MVFKGCERSVITYSSLISACEKAGQSDLAMELFQEMAQEGCVPNTVTYNSLITACAQGACSNSCLYPSCFHMPHLGRLFMPVCKVCLTWKLASQPRAQDCN